MIQAYFDNNENKQLFESDVRALLTAFYPEEEIGISCEQALFGIDKSPKEEYYIELLQYKDETMEDVEGDITVVITCGTKIKSAPVIKDVRLYGDENENHAIRRCIKWLLYDTVSQVTGKALPWGSLTGVRPVGLMSKLLNKGLTVEEAKEYFENEYFVSREKTELAMDVALRQKNLLKDMTGDEHYSLYIGIPFCPTTCLYCSFTSYPVGAYRDLVPDYLKCLKYEIARIAELQKGKKLESIYVGGGTPSALTAEQIDELFECIEEHLNLENLKEITFEAGRPDSISREKLLALKKHGVNRISVNPQTMNDETLKLIGRHHNSQQLKEAFSLARELEFEDINMDIILGLPGEGLQEVKHTLEEIERLSPDSLTIHSLAIKRGSKLNECLIEKKLNPEDYKITDEIVKMCGDYVRSMEMKPYYLYRQKKITDNFENVGYALEGKFCLYNIMTMEEVQNIVACGAGTVSKRVYGDGHIERCDNVKDVELYISKIEEMVERKRQLFMTTEC